MAVAVKEAGVASRSPHPWGDIGAVCFWVNCSGGTGPCNFGW